MKYKILALSLLAYFGVEAQQINPVPDYVFKNQMSVGRNAVTDTAAYFSIGPRYGATKGMMPPMVVDTLTVTGTKRNGLTIFSVQRNKYMYWDSVRVRWSDFAGSSGAYIFASDTASMLSPYLRKVDTTAMLTNYTIGSGTTNYLTKFTGSRTLGNSGVFESGSSIGIGTTSPLQRLHVFSNSTASRIALTGGASNNQGSAISFYQSNNSSALLNIGDKAAITGGAVDTAVIFRAGVNIPMIFEPNADESFRLNANGTVTAKSLAGTGSRIVVANASGTLSASAALSGYVDGSGTTNYIPKFTASSTIGNSLIFDNGTGVGIGTTTPSALLEVSSTSPRVRVVGTTGGSVNQYVTSGGQMFVGIDNSTASLFGNGAYSRVVYGGGAYPLDFYTNDAIRARIKSDGEVLLNTTTDAGAYALQVAGSIYNTTGAVFAASSGNVGIGTTSPSGILDISKSTSGGDVRVYMRNTATTASSTITLDLSEDGLLRSGIQYSPNTGETKFGNITTGNYAVMFYAGANERMRIKSDGEVLIGTTTDAGAYALQVAGATYIAGTLAINTNGQTRTISTTRPTGTSGENIFIGTSGTSLTGTTTGQSSFNTIVGVKAGDSITTGSNNTAFGTRAMQNVKTASNNTSIGFQALLQNVTSSDNTIIGYAAAQNLTSGSYNTAVGSTALLNTTTSTYNTAVGGLTLQGGAGDNNTAVGAGSLYSTTSTDNTGVGFGTLFSLTTGSNNTAIGNQAGRYNNAGNGITTNTNSIFVGSDSRASANGNSNEIVIGYQGRGNGSNTVTIGNSSTTDNYFYGALRTSAPPGGTANAWRLGTVATVTPTSPNRTIEVSIGGTIYYIHAKTTND